MKKLAIAVVIGIMAVCLLGTTVLANDPEDSDPENLDVKVVVIGTNPTVTVEADGNGATVYINGQDIQQPTVYRFENTYNDATLKEAISDLDALLAEAGMNLTVTSDGLAKVILVIGEHTSNLRELLGIVNQNEEDSIGRDNELVIRGESQDLAILQLGSEVIALRDSLSDMEADYQVALSALSANMDARVDELSSDFNEKLVWTWGSVGAFGLLLLGIWRIWQVRLTRN